MCFKPPWGQIFDTVCWTMWKVECQTVWQTVIIFCPDALSAVIRGSNFWESQKSSLYCKQLMAWKWVSFVMLMICHWMLFEAQDRLFRASSTGIIYSWSCAALCFLAISPVLKDVWPVLKCLWSAGGTFSCSGKERCQKGAQHQCWSRALQLDAEWAWGTLDFLSFRTMPWLFAEIAKRN